MASAYTTQFCWLTNRCIRGFAEWTQTDYETATVVSAYGIAQQTNSYLYGVAVMIAIDQPQGVGRASQRANGVLLSNPGASWINVAQTGWASFTFGRTSADYMVYIRIHVWGELTSGYGPAGADTGWYLLGIVVVPKVNPPLSPTNIVNTRNSDFNNTISWTNNPAPNAHYDYLIVYRSVDGGGWSALPGATALPGNATSFVDSTTSPNHSYLYHVVSVNVAGVGNQNVSN